MQPQGRGAAACQHECEVVAIGGISGTNQDKSSHGRLHLNPNIFPANTHPYISNRPSATQFGIPMAEARKLYAQLQHKYSK